MASLFNVSLRSPEPTDQVISEALLGPWKVCRRIHRSQEVLVLYLKRPRAKSWELRRCGGALQIQRLEGSRPAGLWDLYPDEPAVVVCEMALSAGVLPFQLLVAERMVVGRHVRESGAHYRAAF